MFSGLFIAHLTVGGFNIQLYNFVPEVIDMIIAVIIYCGAFALLFKQIINKMIRKPVIAVTAIDTAPDAKIPEITGNNIDAGEIITESEPEKKEEI